MCARWTWRTYHRRRAGRYGGEEVRVEGEHALGVPEPRDHAEDDVYKCDGVFTAGVIINGRWMLVDKEDADWRRSQKICEEMYVQGPGLNVWQHINDVPLPPLFVTYRSTSGITIHHDIHPRG